MIPGLRYIKNFLTEEDEKELINAIDMQTWLPALRRRTQHYGYKYDYTKRTIDASSALGDLPPWLDSLSARLAEEELFEDKPNQVIVNEYMPGQGIGPHIDSLAFGKTVASLSLLSSIEMHFEEASTRNTSDLWLEPMSLLVLKGPARYDWKHSIPARGIDLFNGEKVDRSRRVSLTFRTVPK